MTTDDNKCPFEAWKEYKTRDGRLARVYAIEGGGVSPIHGAVMSRDGLRWVPTSWHSSGRIADNTPYGIDLMPPKPPHEWYDEDIFSAYVWGGCITVEMTEPQAKVDISRADLERMLLMLDEEGEG